MVEEPAALVKFGCHGRLARPCLHWQQAANGTLHSKLTSTESALLSAPCRIGAKLQGPLTSAHVRSIRRQKKKG